MPLRIPTKVKDGASRTNHLFVIGIDKYQNVQIHKKLNNCVRDVKKIREVLLEKFQFEEDYLVELYDEEATRERILNVLEEFEQKLSINDNLLIIFAGHGIMRDNKSEGFWVPVNASDNISEYIRNGSIKDHLRNIKAQHIYLIIDTCFAGTIFNKEELNRGGEAFNKAYDKYFSRRAFGSGRFTKVTDGDGMHSPFAQNIIAFLEAAEEDFNSVEFELEVLKDFFEDDAANVLTQDPVAGPIPGVRDAQGVYTFRVKNQVEAVEIDMIRVEGGEFLMGNEDFSVPAQVSPFEIGKYLITQQQWKAIMGYNPSHFSHGDLYPVETVSWFECQKFLDKLNEFYGLDESTGKNYRFLTETEWEYVAKGGKKGKRCTYAGSNDISEVGWYWKNSGDKPLDGEWNFFSLNDNNCRLHEVGELKPNELGIYDLSGNLKEWCMDWEGTLPGSVPMHYFGPRKGPGKILRGGAWDSIELDCHAAYRHSVSPEEKDFNIGFRIAKDIN